MPIEIAFSEPRRVELMETPMPEPDPDQVLLRIVYSGISHGTEMNAYRGMVPNCTKTVREGLFEPDDSVSLYPTVQGYEDVGEVVAVGTDVHDVSPGELYATISGHRQYCAVDRDASYFHRLPDGFDPRHGVFLALGGVAFDALLSSEVRFGESAVIFGQGIVGLLLTHFCRLAGVNPIIAVDPIQSRRDEAERAGAHYSFAPDTPELAWKVRDLSRGKGVDVAFEMSSSYEALHECFRVTANPYGTVVAGGFHRGEGRGLYLGEEFHHSSHGIGGATKMVALHERIESDTTHWGLRRVLDEVWRQLTTGAIPVDDYITHVFPFSEAGDAFRLVDEHPEACLKVVLDMQG
jgi:2-desacetyl-2-hydroxyethyl bacteriochlorophyllide A dehydrogenase